MGISSDLIHAGERLEDLQYHRLAILQKENTFHFGTDAVLLADFAAPRIREKAIDLGTGTGIIAILMASHQPQMHCTALEIQPEMADMAARSVLLNEMQDQIDVREADYLQAYQTYGSGQFTLAVCNPPYGKIGSTLQSETKTQRIARHEGDCTIEAVCQAASRLLKCGGRFCVVFPAPRMLELMTAMRQYHLEPKRVRTVHHRVEQIPKLVLVEAIMGGKSMLNWMPPLILAEADGTPTAEYRRIYRME